MKKTSCGLVSRVAALLALASLHGAAANAQEPVAWGNPLNFATFSRLNMLKIDHREKVVIDL